MSFLKRFRTPGFLVTVILCTWSCALFQTFRYKNPKVTVTGLEIRQFHILKMELAVNLALENPNSFPLSISNISYLIRYKGQDLANGSKELVEIMATSVSNVTLPFSIKLANTTQLIQALLKQGKTTVDLEISGLVATPIGHFPLSHKKPQEINTSAILQKNN